MKATTKIIIITVIGIVGCTLLMFLLIKPTLQKVKTLNSELVTKKTEVKTLEQQILAFRSAQADLSKVTQRDRILNAIVEPEDLVTAIKDIESAADKTSSSHKLTIDEIKEARFAPNPIIKAKKGVKEVPYTLALRNSYEEVVRFLMYLENLPHFTELSKIRTTAEITSSAVGEVPTQSGNLNVTLDGVFFVKGDEIKPALPVKTNTNEN